MLGLLGDVFRLPDLKRRILFTMGVLFVFRLGAHIPTPGLDARQLADFFQGGGFMDFLNVFSGGALSRFSIFSLGVMPYINASIVMQLLVVIFPYLEKLQKDHDEGRKKIIQWTRYGAVFFATIQAIGLTAIVNAEGALLGGFFGFVVAVTTLVTGSVIVMWLGEEISDHGIGNGISIMIFAGIIVGIPGAVITIFTNLREGQINILAVLLFLVLVLAVVAGCIILQEGQRRLPVQYAKRVVGNKVYGGQSTFIPLKVNQSGVIPIIFASSILIFPPTLAGFIPGDFGIRVAGWFDHRHLVYMLCYVALIIFFAYFYTAVVFNPNDIANNMKKHGGFILGIRPGQPTSDYITKVMERITLGGAIFLAAIALIPNFLTVLTATPAFHFGGTAVLIVVGVALDTVRQIEAQLLMRHYDGILKKSGGKSGSLLRS